MGRLGSAKNALMLVDRPQQENECSCGCETEETPDLGHGWTSLGQGSFKAAWLGPDGIVYKVGLNEDQDEIVREEAHVFRNLRRRGKSWAPESTLWNVEGVPVIAMPEYTPVTGYGGPHRAEPAWREMEREIPDAREHNIGRRNDGSLVLLDAGTHSDEDW